MKQLITLLVVVSILMGCQTVMIERKWNVGEYKYEGYPLLLRFPIGLDYDALSKEYPQLVVATFEFSEVTSNGLPESNYNKSLEYFDLYLSSRIERDGEGITVLIETFSGKRIFYMYSKRELDLEQLKNKVAAQYPKNHLVWEKQLDSGWKFIKKYAHDFNFPTT